MLIAIVVLLISIALSWKRISQGIQKGVNPYLKEMPAH